MHKIKKRINYALSNYFCQMSISFKNKRRFNDYPSFSKRFFGERVQKISVNAGFTCPNRDGTKGLGGCTFCNNQSFNPEYCTTQLRISEQLQRGINFFRPKYKTQKYLAYFQAYTNTYEALNTLKVKYEEALKVPGVIGLVVGTRPDCMPDELLQYFKLLQKEYYITIEYGLESTLNTSLELINRGHDYETSVQTIKRTHAAGIHTGAHLILGLPKESRSDILLHAKRISELPLHTLKLHQLQLVKGTKMAQQYKQNPEWFTFYSVDEYIDLVIDFIEILNPEIIIERFISQSPLDLLINQRWGIKNFEFIHRLEKRLEKRNTYQGKLYQP